MSTLLDIAGLTKAPTKKAKQEKPLLPDPSGELTPLVARAITAKSNIEANGIVIDQVKTSLAEASVDYLFRHYSGRSDIEDTFQIGTSSGKATISLKNAYKLPENLDEVRPLLGGHADSILTKSFIISISADAIPALYQQTFVNELIKLARSMDSLTTPDGEDGPVFKAITAIEKVSVDKAFHEGRHKMFSADQNLRIQRVMPCVISMRLDY